MPFFEFDQNNSGGRFVVNDKVCHRLFIEAKSASEANDIAEGLGVYFAGCASGDDCECCGDRWYSVCESDAVEFPKVYSGLNEKKAKEIAETYKAVIREVKDNKWGTHEAIFDSVEQYARYQADNYGWTSPDVRIYYANGSVLEINSAAVDAENARKDKKRKKKK